MHDARWPGTGPTWNDPFGRDDRRHRDDAWRDHDEGHGRRYADEGFGVRDDGWAYWDEGWPCRDCRQWIDRNGWEQYATLSRSHGSHRYGEHFDVPFMRRGLVAVRQFARSTPIRPWKQQPSRSRPQPHEGLKMCDDGRARPAWAATDPLMREYYDTEWGMPVTDEQGLFERIALESFQSGLSWSTVLRKREAFRAAFADFDPDAVAAFGEYEVERLVTDPGIIRNRTKILATIANARATIAMRDGVGLPAFVWSFRPERTPVPVEYEDVPSTSVESMLLAAELKERGFSWVGPTSMFALMEAIGIVDTNLVGTHRRGASGLWDAQGRPVAEAWAAMPGGGERWPGLPVAEAGDDPADGAEDAAEGVAEVAGGAASEGAAEAVAEAVVPVEE